MSRDVFLTIEWVVRAHAGSYRGGGGGYGGGG